MTLSSEVWIAIGTLIGGLIGGLVGFFTQRLQIKHQEKRERRREVVEAYKLAIDSICTYLAVAQQEFTEYIWDTSVRQARKNSAIIGHYRSVAYLRMLGENELADESVKLVNYIAQTDGQTLAKDWEIVVLGQHAYPLLEKINQRLKEIL